jgi:hypothetical protein
MHSLARLGAERNSQNEGFSQRVKACHERIYNQNEWKV